MGGKSDVFSFTNEYNERQVVRTSSIDSMRTAKTGNVEITLRSGRTLWAGEPLDALAQRWSRYESDMHE